MNHTPPITVLMPVYNASAFLRLSIDSVIYQTYSNFEFVIINDGSTDDSEEIISHYTDNRICYHKNEANLGLIATLNRGIGIATGKYILRMDADDICQPDRFSKQVSFMEGHLDIGISGCCADVIDKPYVKMRYDSDDALIRVKMLYQCHMLHPSVIIRKDVIDKFHFKYDPAFLHAEDYDLFYRISKVTKLANLPDTLLFYREHNESVSRLNSEVQQSNSIKVIKQQFKDIGLNTTTTEIEIFKGFMNSRFDLTVQEIAALEILLLRIINSNRQTNLLNEVVMIDLFASKWKNLLLNVPASLAKFACRMANQSAMSKYCEFTLKERFKLTVKSLV